MVRTAGAGMLTTVLAIALATTAGAETPKVPPALGKLLPAGYVPMVTAQARPDPKHVFVFVVLAKKGEPAGLRVKYPSARPLIVFQQTGSGFREVARNDRIILRSNEGGQCDPFEGGDVKTKGRYMTVEHNAACGFSHWESTTTFRFDSQSGAYIFDNERYQSLKFNPDQRPDAEALIPDIDYLKRAKGRAITLSQWRRRN